MNNAESQRLEELMEEAFELLQFNPQIQIVLIDSDESIRPVTYEKATMGGLLPVPGIPTGADVSNLFQIVVQWPRGTETLTYQRSREF